MTKEDDYNFEDDERFKIGDLVNIERKGRYGGLVVKIIKINKNKKKYTYRRIGYYGDGNEIDGGGDTCNSNLANFGIFEFNIIDEKMARDILVMDKL